MRQERAADFAKESKLMVVDIIKRLKGQHGALNPCVFGIGIRQIENVCRRHHG